MYTECFVSGRIKADDPARAVLEFMFGDGPKPFNAPFHEFFSKPRWTAIGRCSSYYFQPEPLSKAWIDDISGELHFVSRSDLKNYDGEIAAFFDWLKTTGAEFFGYSRYEESPLRLTLYADAATTEEDAELDR
jgi:hypothetical protein